MRKKGREATATPLVLTESDRRHLEKNPLTPLPEIQQEFCDASGTTVSVSTIRRALPLLGYHACAGARKPWVSSVNQIIRLKWCRARSDWDEEWKSVIWSDESRSNCFALTTGCGRGAR